ncbi:MAG: hypothetical protein NZ899_08090 [Thermoguttaceae bacterium]|nr:hypothetical protein [Thermoguttaceae bacterium]MDW8078095.1 hypothetical protein [Thermoguttaceae bacterium]
MNARLRSPSLFAFRKEAPHCETSSMGGCQCKSRRWFLRRASLGAAGIFALPSFQILSARAYGVAAAQAAGRKVEVLPSGVEVWQVTTEEVPQSNIYCEVPYTSADGKYFVYWRRPREISGPNRLELLAVEFGSWRQEKFDQARTISGCAITPDGHFYYIRSGDSPQELWRIDLSTGKRELVCAISPGTPLTSLGTVTSDHRFYACGTRTDPSYKLFDILLVDLQSGEQKIIDRDPYILNPHPQFDPGDGSRLMIQHNRGGRYTPDGKLERLVGPEGATLYLLTVPKGERILLRVGTPYTTACTGHEAWIGSTGEILFSVAWSGDFSPEKGNLLGIRPGENYRVVARGYRFNHVGATRCGRLFSADDWQPPFKVVIGSTRTGQTVELCASHTSPTSDQATHVHPYISTDLRWVVFNSNRFGAPHIFAASIPDKIREELQAG